MTLKFLVDDKMTIAEDGSSTLQFIVGDDITAYANLTVTAKAVNPSNTTLDDTSLINTPIVSAPDASGNRTLTFATKPNLSGPAAVKITAVDPGGITSEKVFYVNIDPRADTPLVTQARPLAGTLDTGSLALDIQAALTDQDGSETLEIRISNIPTGLTLNKGTNLSGGVWSLTPAQLSGLTLVGPSTWSADLTGAAALNVTAISREQANGSTASYGPADNQIANSRFLNGQANWQMATNKVAGTTGWGNNLSIDWAGSGNDVLFSTMYGAQAAGGHDRSGRSRRAAGQSSPGQHDRLRPLRVLHAADLETDSAGNAWQLVATLSASAQCADQCSANSHLRGPSNHRR